jgi:curved DNA-binding protein CbpA
MGSPAAGKFQDHYEVLGIKFDATSELIQKAYTDLAARYNPRNPETGNKEKFENVNFAYETLIDPQQRKLFDTLRAPSGGEELPKFTGRRFFEDVANEVYTRQTLLCILYDRRRLNPISPAISIRLLDKMIQTTPENLELAIWYLKQRSLVIMDDKSRLEITVDGMDFLVSNPPNPESILALMKATALAEQPVPSNAR